MALFGGFGTRGPYRRGEIRIKYTKLLVILEAIGVVMLVVMLAYTAFRYSMLPDQIPKHYGVTGEVDSWGSKGSVWLVPVISVLVYGMLTIAAFFPNAWNYPAKIPLELLPLAEDKARQMIMWMKLLITGLFIYLQFKTLHLSHNVSMGITFGFMLLLFVVLIYYLGAFRRLARNKTGLLK